MSKSILFVHGAWHQGNCWDAIGEMFKKDGYRVYTPTYPGNSESDNKHVKPNDYLNWLEQEVNSLNGKVIVVGHSSAGIIMSGSLHRVADKIEMAVFMNAFIPPNNTCQFDCIENEVVEAFTSMANAREDKCVPLDSAFLRAKLMQEAPEELYQEVVDNLIVQPIAIFQTVAESDKLRNSEIPCGMVHFTDDKSVPQDTYKNMFLSVGRGKVVEISGEHELIISNPTKVYEALKTLLP